MSWKGTVRSLAAIQRQSERTARQRHNQLVKQQKQLEKMEELERASYEVEEFENCLDVLSSIHKECSSPWDWHVILATEPPIKPELLHDHEKSAINKFNGYKPGITDKLLKRIDMKREELSKNIDIGRQLDQEKYQSAVTVYEQELIEWQTTHDLADHILAHDKEAYKKAIIQAEPFIEIIDHGSSVEYEIPNNTLIDIILHVNSEDVIPKQMKTLLKSGKLSVKEMPKSKFYEIYQDYICGCVLRIAREIFALLPIELAIITAVGKILNTKTGYLEESPILSVAIPRTTLQNLNFELLDPSDSMTNFLHRMNFKKTTGFSVVTKISPSELHDG